MHFSVCFTLSLRETKRKENLNLRMKKEKIDYSKFKKRNKGGRKYLLFIDRIYKILIIRFDPNIFIYSKS